MGVGSAARIIAVRCHSHCKDPQPTPYASQTTMNIVNIMNIAERIDQAVRVSRFAGLNPHFSPRAVLLRWSFRQTVAGNATECEQRIALGLPSSARKRSAEEEWPQAPPNPPDSAPASRWF